MKLNFKPISLPNQIKELSDFLINNPWPYHVNRTLTADKLNQMIEDGLFASESVEFHYI